MAGIWVGMMVIAGCATVESFEVRSPERGELVERAMAIPESILAIFERASSRAEAMDRVARYCDRFAPAFVQIFAELDEDRRAADAVAARTVRMMNRAQGLLSEERMGWLYAPEMALATRGCEPASAKKVAKRAQEGEEDKGKLDPNRPGGLVMARWEAHQRGLLETLMVAPNRAQAVRRAEAYCVAHEADLREVFALMAAGGDGRDYAAVQWAHAEGMQRMSVEMTQMGLGARLGWLPSLRIVDICPEAWGR